MNCSICLQKIIEALNAKVLVGPAGHDVAIDMICASDLMSDVLSFSKSNALLLTGLTNPQTVRTAEVAEISAICFVHGKPPQSETIELAQSSNMILLVTKYSMFSACGRLYAEGLVGCDDV